MNTMKMYHCLKKCYEHILFINVRVVYGRRCVMKKYEKPFILSLGNAKLLIAGNQSRTEERFVSCGASSGSPGSFQTTQPGMG